MFSGCMYLCEPESLTDKEIIVDPRSLQVIDEIRSRLRELESRDVPSEVIEDINRILDSIPSQIERNDSIWTAENRDFVSVVDESTVPWDTWDSPTKAAMQEWRRIWPTARGILRKEIRDAQMYLANDTGVIIGANDTIAGAFYISDEQLGFHSSSSKSPTTIMWDEIVRIEPVGNPMKVRSHAFEIRYGEDKVLTMFLDSENSAHSIAHVYEYNKHAISRIAEVDGGGRNSLTSVMSSMMPDRANYMNPVLEKELNINFAHVREFFESSDLVWEFYSKYFDALGHWEMRWSDDENTLVEHPDHGGLQKGRSKGVIKVLSMKVPIPKTLFTPDSADCEVVFQKIIYDSLIVIESSTITMGVPASDAFSVKNRIEITPSENGAVYKLQSGLCWTKSTWLESIITSQTNSATEKGQPIYLGLLEELITKSKGIA